MYELLRNIKRAIRRRIRKYSASRLEQDKPSYSKFWLVAAVIFAILFSSFLFPLAQLYAPISTLDIGEVPSEDIIAPFDFPVYKSQGELDNEIRLALAALPAVLIYDQRVVDSLFVTVDRLFFLTDSLKSVVGNRSRIADRLRLFFPQIKIEILMKLAAWDSLDARERIINAALRDRYIVGIARLDSLVPVNYSEVIVVRPNRETAFAADQILSRQQGQQKLLEDIQIHAGDYIDDARDLYAIAREFLQPNLTFSLTETEKRREKTLMAIPREKLVIKAGQRLVARNEPITRNHLEWLAAMAKYRSSVGTEQGTWQFLLPIVARVAFVAFVFFSFLYVLYHLRPKGEFCFSRIVPLLLITMMILLSAYLITEQGHLPSTLIPVAAGIILVAILYDLQVAVFTSVALAMLLGIVFEFDFETAFRAIIAGVMAAVAMRVVQKRTDFYRCALHLSITLAASNLLLESLKLSDTSLVLKQCGLGVVNAVGSTFIAMALLPLFESFFSFTTSITLLELSDLNHPLLKRLAIEAPGTYHHSLVLSSLTEAAAKAVGANPLLARVGTYYHDIGKMEISEYFVENQFGVKSRHDELAPSMSALVIVSHIKRGREMAEEYDLPDRIIEFILEHHGTSLISFFYNKAKELSSNGDTSEAEFRYPGPRPRSKETAILMIADSVEAASRTLDDPKPSRIRSLIRRITTDKYQAEQLSESPLSLADLQKIEDAFVMVLIGAFHNRIDYPHHDDEKSN
jgi:cyclic-di-AMP phosphodiesterase PgpH